MRFCSIASGSSGNCSYIGTENTHVLVDAGISGRRIEKGLSSLSLSCRDIDAILLTHEHTDHIQGLGVLARKYGIPIYASAGTAEALTRQKTTGEIPSGLLHTIREEERFSVKELSILPFALPHDAAEPVGFRVEYQEKAVGIATDLGHYGGWIIEALRDLDAVLLEANHDVGMLETGSYPYALKQRILGDHGHLSNENAGRLLCRILGEKMKAVLLGHLSKENNYEALAYLTVCSEVTMGDNPYTGEELPIYVAPRDAASRIVTI